MSKPQPMTALAFATYTRYRELYGAAVWPNIDTQIKMQAYDPYDPDIRPSDLVDAVVNTSAGVPSEFFVSWVRGAVHLFYATGLSVHRTSLTCARPCGPTN